MTQRTSRDPRTMGRRGHAQRVLLAVLAALLPVAIPRAWSDVRAGEYQIKAAFVCKFGNYVEWPLQLATGPGPGKQFTIGVVATDEVADEMANIARGQTVNGNAIAVRRLARGDPLDGLDIVFVARSHAMRLAETLARAEGRPILTVSESDPDVAVGSMVTFVVIDDKVRFDIALAEVERSNLKISARLLALARAVNGRALQ